MNLFNLEDKVILITGGCGVLGGSIAKYLLENNATVILLHYKEAPLLATVQDLKKISDKVYGQVCNVVEENSLQTAADKIIGTHQKIDVLINAAGGNKPGATVGIDQSVFDVDLAQFKQVIDLNLFGSILPSLVFGKEMAKQKKERSSMYLPWLQIERLQESWAIRPPKRRSIISPNGWP